MDKPLSCQKVLDYSMIAISGEKSKLEIHKNCIYKCKNCDAYSENCTECSDYQPSATLMVNDPQYKQEQSKSRKSSSSDLNCDCDQLSSDYYLNIATQACYHREYISPYNSSECNLGCCHQSICSESDAVKCRSNSKSLKLTTKNAFNVVTGTCDQVKCISGEYYDITAMKCTQCQPQCLQCTGIDQCQVCKVPSEQTIPKCSCPANKTLDSAGNCINVPIICDPKCKTCDAKGKCSSCESPKTLPNCDCPSQYYETPAKTCIQCQHPCLTCNASQCIQCKQEKGIQRIMPSCSCPNNYYESPNQTCQKCSHPCLTCQNKATTCLLCKIEKYIQRVLPDCTCPETYYESASQTCEKCDHPCLNCQNKATTCLSCRIEKDVQRNLPDCACPQDYKENENKECVVIQKKQKVLTKEEQVYETQQAEQKEATAQATQAVAQGTSTVVISTIIIALLKAFQNFSLPFVPSFFELFMDLEQKKNEFMKKTPLKFQQNDINSLYMKNIGQTLSIFSTFASVMCVIKILELTFKKIKKFPKIQVYLRKQITRFKWNGIVEVVWMEYLNISIAGGLQFLTFQTGSILDIFNILLWVIFGSAFLAYPIYFAFKVFIFTKSRNEQFRQQFENLWDGNKHSDVSSILFNFLLYMRKILFSFSIVFLHEHPTIQLSFISFLNCGLIIYMLVYKPFQQNSALLANVLTELTMLGFQITTLLSCDEFHCSNSGYDLVFLILFMMTYHLVLLFYNIITSNIQKYRIKKRNHHQKYDRRRVKFQEELQKDMDILDKQMDKKSLNNSYNIQVSSSSDLEISPKSDDYLEKPSLNAKQEIISPFPSQSESMFFQYSSNDNLDKQIKSRKSVNRLRKRIGKNSATNNIISQNIISINNLQINNTESQSNLLQLEQTSIQSSDRKLESSIDNIDQQHSSLSLYAKNISKQRKHLRKSHFALDETNQSIQMTTPTKYNINNDFIFQNFEQKSAQEQPRK